MDKRLAEKLNEQIKNEMYSAYLYLSMSAYFEYEGWQGFGKWMKLQAKEEMEHAMKIFDYLSERNQRIILQAIPQPPYEFSSSQDIFEKVLEHEKKITKTIHDLYNLAKELGDLPTQVFLQWFINEQVEEEKNALDILSKLKIIEPNSGAFFMLDKVLGERS